MHATLLTLLVAAPLFGAPAGAATPALGDALVTWNAPTRFVKGLSFPVSVRIAAPDDGAAIADWVLTPGAFLLDGKPVQRRQGQGIVELAPGSVLTLEVDLGRAIESSAAFRGKDFQLAFAKEYLENEPIGVRVYQRAPEGTDFMAIPAEELADYHVIMETSPGNMVFEFLPDKAPMHVRNFLDLCQSGFYAGTQFHRVSPTFMVQGGCPNTKTDNWRTWGQGGGPRRLDAEFNDVKHERGVLSMARGGEDKNSASCQFFVITAPSNFLDGEYSAFGRLVAGDETLERIANAKGVKNDRDQTVRPNEPPKILSTTVVRAAGGGSDQ